MGQQGGSPPEFLSTHPSENTRIQRLQALMPRAMQAYEAAKAAGR
jgi:predicted Zn-dependent protease